MDWSALSWIYVLCGLAVGFIVGVTGVGGGSLMTPILLAFGIPPAKAVGTDLLYAAITKTSGVFVHQKQRNINWRITGLLAAGSLPGSLVTLWVLSLFQTNEAVINILIKQTLGVALMFTAVAIVFKQSILDAIRRGKPPLRQVHLEIGHRRSTATVLIGVFLGAIVTLTSIGAGALGTVALFILFPTIPTAQLVGTEIAHAVPLTLLAGMGHAGLGNINWTLLANLLIGSLPGIYVGSHLSGKVPDFILRPALATMLALVGLKLIW